MTSHLATVQSDAVVVSLMRASTALAEAKTIQQTKKIMDVAAAAEIYARRQHLGDEAEALAVSIKVEALRKLGEMLKASPKAAGVKGRFTGGSKLVPPAETAPTLTELGLTKKESAVAQKLAALPEAEFQQVRDGHVTVTKAIAAVTQAKAAPKAPEPTAAQIEAAQIAEDAHGDFDPVAELEAAQAEIAELRAQLTAAEADDQKAETLKWRRLYESAQRTAAEKQDAAHRYQTELQRAADRLTRIGKLFGERDPAKIPALVESFYRQHARAVA